MSYSAIKNVVAVVGKYTAPDGTEKNRYQNVGKLLKNKENNTTFILLDKTFNPAGVNNGKSSVALNFYDIKDQESKDNTPINSTKTNSQAPQPPNVGQDPNDDIPF